MWKKGELVWMYFPDKWIPGRILDPSAPVGVFVSFFGLMEPRYVPKPCLRSFDRDFGTLISDSWTFRRFVNRALLAHFWNISFGLWCPCQPPIDSPHLDRDNSLPWFPLNSESALDFVRDMAISQRVTLRRLAETNSWSAQILSFRRYTVDFKRSESVYEEIRASTKLIDHSEESGWCLDPSDPDVKESRDLSLRDPLPKDILSSEQPVGKVVRIYTWNIRRHLTKSGSSIIKACEKTMAQTADHEDDGGHPSKSRESCQAEQSICLLNSEPPIEDITEEDTISNKEFSSDDVAIAPAEHLQDLGTAVTVENKTREVDNVRSIGVKRKASRDKASARKSKRKKKAGQPSVPTTDNNPQNLHMLKDMRLADPKCLRMKFLSRHGNLPSKAELLKRFSVFGKIDDSRTDVNLEKSSAKVVFLQSIDAVTAYQFARRKKFTLGRSKVIFRLDPFEEASKVCPNTSEVNKVPRTSVPTLKPCLKKHGLTDDKEEERRNLKVKFRMETNS